MLAKLHEECDSLGTGVVRTTVLVQKLKYLVKDNPTVDKEHLTELSRLLDPKDDDGHVKKEEFIAIGMEWIDMLDQQSQSKKMASKIDSSNIISFGSETENCISNGIINGHSSNIATVSKPINFDSNNEPKIYPINNYVDNLSSASLGLLDSVILQNSYHQTDEENKGRILGESYLKRSTQNDDESYNDNINRNWTYSLNNCDTFDISKEEALEFHHEKKINDLLSENRRISLEATTLKKQLESAEDEAAQFLSENELLRTQLKERRKSKANEISCPNISPSNLQNNRRHSTDGSYGKDEIKNETFALNGFSTVEDIDSYHRKHLDRHEILEEENRYFRKELQRHKKRIKELETHERKTSEKVDSLEHEIELKKGEILRLKQMLPKSSSQEKDHALEESRLMINRLEDEIKKLKADLTTALDEISQMCVQQTQDNWRDVFGEKGRLLTFSASEISFDQLPGLNKPHDEFDEVLPVRKSVSDPIKQDNRPIKLNGPAASSTPFIFTPPRIRPCRGSIGDEMKKLGVNGSPMLGKPSSILKTIDCQQQNAIKNQPVQQFPTSVKKLTSVVSKSPKHVKETKNAFCQTDNIPNETKETIFHQSSSDVSKDISKEIKVISSIRLQFISRIKGTIVSKSFWFRVLLSCISILVIFTFFGAYEIDDVKYYPITWPKGIAEWLKLNSRYIRIPEPFAIFKKKHIYPPII